MPTDTSDELVSVLVPRRLYARVIQMLAGALAAETGGSSHNASPPSESRWTPEEIRHLRRLVNNKTAQALMDLTCAAPGKRVTFKKTYERAGRTYGQARADLAGFSKLIRKNFNRDTWPVTVEQGPDKGLTYYAEPSIAKAWNSAST